MTWIAEAHAQWHLVHGRDAVCPLDCGAGEVPDEADLYGPGDVDPSPEAPVVWTDPWTDPSQIAGTF